MNRQKPRPRFAEGTSVPIEKTRTEIETLVRKHGAESFASAWERDRFVVIFGMRGRRLRFVVSAPDPKKYRETNKWDAENRRRWRALLLILKAKLEVVSSEDADLDAEFMAYIVLPNGESIGQRLLPELEQLLSGAPMPPLLGSG